MNSFSFFSCSTFSFFSSTAQNPSRGRAHLGRLLEEGQVGGFGGLSGESGRLFSLGRVSSVGLLCASHAGRRRAVRGTLRVCSPRRPCRCRLVWPLLARLLLGLRLWPCRMGGIFGRRRQIGAAGKTATVCHRLNIILRVKSIVFSFLSFFCLSSFLFHCQLFEHQLQRMKHFCPIFSQ